MEAKDILFDEDQKMVISINSQQEKLTLFLSDDLMATDEDLSDGYREKISNFINKSDIWYSYFKNYISMWGEKEYGVDTQKETYVLMSVFVLFEQAEDDIYGLEFGVDFDEEHNCGIKVKVIDNGFEIFEIGTGDVAFA